jgi:hypothetical protein
MKEGSVLMVRTDVRRVLQRCDPEGLPFDESGLQEFLRLHPEILPVGHYGESFLPLICIGREVQLGGSCRIDNLYVSPAGYLTLVETKLWKNAEQHREVVAQVLEYARQLQSATYQELDEACRAYTREYEAREQSLAERLAGGEESPQDLADTVISSLPSGNFKVIIVGDRIHENLIDLTEFLGRFAHLSLGLSLVELACYRLGPASDDGFMLVPRLALRTVEVERAVVRIALAEGVPNSISVQAEAPRPPIKGMRPPALDEGEFYERLSVALGGRESGRADTAKVREWVDELQRELGLETEPKISTLTLKARLPWDQDRLGTVLELGVKGVLVGNGGWGMRLQKAGLSPDPALRFCGELQHIHSGFDFKPTKKGYLGWPSVPLGEVLPSLARISDVVRKFLDDIALAHEKSQTPSTTATT